MEKKLFITGLGVEVVAFTAPYIWPGAPLYIWYILFIIGVFLILYWPATWIMGAWKKWGDIRQADREDGTSINDKELSQAIYEVACLSAWGKWQEAMHSTASGPYPEVLKIDLAAFAVLEALADGKITAEGRRRGEIDYEPIQPSFWKTVKISTKPDKRIIWRAYLEPRNGLEPEAAEKIPDYQSIQIKGGMVERVWPRHDKALEAKTKKLLKKAKKEAADATR